MLPEFPPLLPQGPQSTLQTPGEVGWCPHSHQGQWGQWKARFARGGGEGMKSKLILALPTLSWSRLGTGMTPPAHPKGSGTPRTLTQVSVSPPGAAAGSDPSLQPLQGRFGVFQVGMISFLSQREIPWIRTSSNGGFLLFPPPRQEQGLVVPCWCLGVKASLFGLCAQKGFCFSADPP